MDFRCKEDGCLFENGCGGRHLHFWFMGLVKDYYW